MFKLCMIIWYCYLCQTYPLSSLSPEILKIAKIYRYWYLSLGKDDEERTYLITKHNYTSSSILFNEYGNGQVFYEVDEVRVVLCLLKGGKKNLWRTKFKYSVIYIYIDIKAD